LNHGEFATFQSLFTTSVRDFDLGPRASRPAPDPVRAGRPAVPENSQPMTFFSRSAFSSSAERPAMPDRTVSVCSPSEGGGRVSSTGVSEK
jgi:hypothetical protein